jgi:holo-[acyl-carrier protein] synthase
MISGIGIDIAKVARIAVAVEKWGERFLRRVFTDREIRYSFSMKDPYPSLSVRFAAKEAMIKAIGSRSFPFREMEVVNLETGMPVMEVKGEIEGYLKEHGISKVHLSLAHEKEYAVACVILE